MSNHDIAFQVTDPRGNLVICTEECWHDHILSARPFMEGREDKVIAAISNPTFGIYRDAQFPNRCVYYRRQTKPRYIKVIVVEQETGPHKVVTAYYTDSMKRGEVLIWTPSSVL